MMGDDYGVRLPGPRLQVVRHQHIGVQDHLIVLQTTLQLLKEAHTVRILEEDSRPSVLYL
jgi:hypothetical protein